MNTEQIARAVYAGNARYRRSIGEIDPPEWDSLDKIARMSIIDGVLYVLSNPGATAEQAHDNWMATKLQAGWQHGETYAPDANPPRHPNLVAWGDLTAEQQAKDHLFVSTVTALAAAARELPMDTQRTLQLQADDQTAPPPASLGRTVLVNTPGRPVDGKTQHAGLVIDVSDETTATVWVLPANGHAFVQSKLRRADTIKDGADGKTASWQHVG